jgi:hypothetical protein
LLGCVFACPARAQQPAATTPRFEAAGAYDYVWANAADSGGGFSLNGGSASFAYNFRDHLAIVGDFGAYRFNNLGQGLTSTVYTYAFGPRLPIHLTRGKRQFTPFAQVLFGGGRLNASANGVNAGENGLALIAGGGIDLSRGHHFAIRLFEADYLLTRFAHPDGSSATQNNLRLSAGLVFRFGSR